MYGMDGVDGGMNEASGFDSIGCLPSSSILICQVGNQIKKNMGSTAVHGWRRRDDDSARDSKPPGRSVSQPEFRVRGIGGDAGLAERTERTRCRL